MNRLAVNRCAFVVSKPTTSILSTRNHVINLLTRTHINKCKDVFRVRVTTHRTRREWNKPRWLNDFFPVVRSSKDDTYVENPRKKLYHVIGKKETENCKDNDRRIVKRDKKNRRNLIRKEILVQCKFENGGNYIYRNFFIYVSL